MSTIHSTALHLPPRSISSGPSSRRNQEPCLIDLTSPTESRPPLPPVAGSSRQQHHQHQQLAEHARTPTPYRSITPEDTEEYFDAFFGTPGLDISYENYLDTSSGDEEEDDDDGDEEEVEEDYGEEDVPLEMYAASFVPQQHTFPMDHLTHNYNGPYNMRATPVTRRAPNMPQQPYQGIEVEPLNSLSHGRSSSSSVDTSTSPPPAKRRRTAQNETLAPSNGQPAVAGSSSSSLGTSQKLNNGQVEAVDMVDVDDDGGVQKLMQKQREDMIKSQEKENGNKMRRLVDFKCVICLDEPTDLCVTLCGHLFCNNCIKRTLKFGAGPMTSSASVRGGKCPVCRGKVNIKDIVAMKLKSLRLIRASGSAKGKEKAIAIE